MEEIKVKINTPFIKLDQLLKFAGLTETGGHAKEIINEGLVYVNEKICFLRGKKIIAGDIVKIDDYVLIIENEN